MWAAIGAESVRRIDVTIQTGRVVKHSSKIDVCRKSLCSNGLRHILHVVSRKMDAVALRNGAVCYFGAPALKIDVTKRRFVFIST
ncbi:hypothetical protein [Burkholderia sp. MSMB1072]|uniref:hypothetical protein n=1 Tax=Burkholderia sp. MSMB1072 TaxID=1637871 RepID=UPI0012E3DDB2|nr:hypothetical protein [Burkholderia sp. MSMB1072]